MRFAALYSIPEVAEKLGKSRYWIWCLVRKQKLACETWERGKRTEYRITEESLQDFMETHNSKKGRPASEKKQREQSSEQGTLSSPEV